MNFSQGGDMSLFKYSGGLFGKSLVSLAARMMFVVVGFLTTWLTAAKYGASAVGTVATVTTLVTLGAIAANAGTSSSVSYYVPSQIHSASVRSARRSYRRVVGICLIGSVISGGVLALVGGLRARHGFLASTPQPAVVLLVISVVGIPLRLFSDLSGIVLRALDSIFGFAIIVMMPAVVTLVGLFAAIALGRDWMSAVWALIGGFAVTALVGTLWVGARFRALDDGTPETGSPAMREILRHSLPMLVSTVGAYIVTGSGVLVVSALGTQSDAGVYSVALRVATITSLVCTAVNSITTPVFARLHAAGSDRELVALARQASRLMALAVVPISIVLLLIGRSMLGWVFGEEFTDAYTSMAILLVGQMFNAFTGSSDFVLNMAGMQRQLRNIIAPAALLCVLLSIALVPLLGVVGAALAYTVSLIGWNFAAAVVLRRRYGEWLIYLPAMKRRS